ncbi:MAG: hypothetical protein HN929_04950 [Chloroflexi bacterium]|mgnify:CR=1 FL=1|jgi:hypothetical protein|nr:hypothetical protein [Chloroflexota bacterium]MBT7080801.1 hypothetical protein [Chloroflexota bacterium]MBT7289959.1 hypothetical protein [Chloroflexota bacterium]
MEFKLLGDKAEVAALNKYPSGCIKHLGLVKYMKNLCKRQQATTLGEVLRLLDSYSPDLSAKLKDMIAGQGIVSL